MLNTGLTHLTMMRMMKDRANKQEQKRNQFFKDELGGKIMKEFCGLRAKPYAYLMDDDSEKEKAKVTKKCLIKRRLMFENYKDCLFNDKIILKSQQRLKSDCHNVYTKQINKKALSSNDIKDFRHLTKLERIPMEQMLLKYAKVKCYG